MRAEASGELVGGEGFVVEALAQCCEGRVELSEEVGIGQTAPAFVVHRLVAGGADAADGFVWGAVAGDESGEVVAVLDE